MKMRWPTSLKFPRSRPAPPSRPSPLRVQARPAAIHRARSRAMDPAEDYDEEDQPTTKLSVAFFVVVALHVVAVGGIYAFNSIKANRTAAPEPAVAAAKDPAPKVTAPAKIQPVADKPAAPVVRPVSNTSLPVGGSRIHQVHAGDSLAKIAAQNGVSASELAEFNGLKESAILRQGQILNLPPAKSTASGSKTATAAAPAKPTATAPAPAKPTTSAAPGAAKTREDFLAAKASEATPKKASTKVLPKTYTVEKGDTVMAIVRKLGVPYDELMKANKIEDPKKLQIGTVLKVPGAK